MSLRDSHPLQAAHRGTPAAVSRSRVTLVTELADRLRSERASAGLSQTTLAGEDFSPSYISLIESGRRTPTEGALQVLAARLGTTAEYLRHGDNAPSEARARLEIGFAPLALTNGEAEQARDRLFRLAVGQRPPGEADLQACPLLAGGLVAVPQVLGCGTESRGEHLERSLGRGSPS